jgi:hypothetical protein
MTAATTATRTSSTLNQMYAALASAGGHWTKGVAYVAEMAGKAAEDYHAYGTAYAMLQPGNSTRYPVVLHDLVLPIALELADHALKDQSLDDFRVAAYPQSMAASLGGELLVSLPENFGGRSMVVGLPALLTPEYVGEQLGTGLNDATVIATFLTGFSESLDALRAGVATGAEDHNAPHTFDPNPHLLGKFCKQCSLPAKNKRHSTPAES